MPCSLINLVAQAHCIILLEEPIGIYLVNPNFMSFTPISRYLPELKLLAKEQSYWEKNIFRNAKSKEAFLFVAIFRWYTRSYVFLGLSVIRDICTKETHESQQLPQNRSHYLPGAYQLMLILKLLFCSLEPLIIYITSSPACKEVSFFFFFNFKATFTQMWNSGSSVIFQRHLCISCMRTPEKIYHIGWWLKSVKKPLKKGKI